MSAGSSIAADRLVELAAALLVAAGVPADNARLTGEALAAADLEGVASHGLMLLPMYLDRLAAGSVDPGSRGEVLSSRGGAIVMDGRNGLGQVTSTHAVSLVLKAARDHGYGVVSVRNGFHFGTAGYWAERIARAGHIGIVLSNTRPLMPPPGGAAALVGNNPIAIALPSSSHDPLLLDLALSEAAMGKIRNAAAAGSSIPVGWATDREGRPTTDPAEAINGMLLPVGGPKGFGLAVIVELLTGGLSGGGTGDAVRPLYGDAAVPYNCSHFFLALDPTGFGAAAAFPGAVAGFADRIRATPPAPGVETVMAPGDPARRIRQRSAGRCQLAPATRDALIAAAARAGVDAARYLT